MAQGHKTQDVRHKTVARCARRGGVAGRAEVLFGRGELAAGFYHAAAGDCGPPCQRVRSGDVAGGCARGSGARCGEEGATDSLCRNMHDKGT